MMTNEDDNKASDDETTDMTIPPDLGSVIVDWAEVASQPAGFSMLLAEYDPFTEMMVGRVRVRMDPIAFLTFIRSCTNSWNSYTERHDETDGLPRFEAVVRGKEEDE